jgi:hypothetical protein
MHVDFHKINTDLGYVTWYHKVFLSILDLVHDESKIVEILWNEGGSNVISYFNHNNIPITKENFIKHIFECIGISAGQYSFLAIIQIQMVIIVLYSTTNLG